MQLKNYTKQDTSNIKGFAILCICLHNFFHHLAPSTGENEFYYSINHINNFFSLTSRNPGDFINILFSFLGHYGVQIFIFISGYGLALSMLRDNKTWLNFVIDRLKKLYPLLLTGVIFYILMTILMSGSLPWEVYLKDINYKLLFINTLLPKQGLSVNGPWWFFGLIFQLYLVFPVIFYLIKKYNTKAFIAICVLSYSWIFLSQYCFNGYTDIYLLQNFPGHLPEFCLGLYIALNKDKKINNILFFIALIIFCLGNFYKFFFPFTFLSITVIVIFSYQSFKNIPIRKSLLKHFLMHLGNVSMTLFVIHGFLRQPFISLANNSSFNTELGNLFVAFLFFVTSYFLSFAALRLYELLLALFDKIKLPEKDNKVASIVSRILQLSLIIFSVYLLYYYYCQINLSNAEQIAQKGNTSENIMIENKSTYSTIANIDFDKNHKTIKIEGSMDIKKLKPNTKIPPIVIQIDEVLWDKIDIKDSFSVNDFSSFELKYDYYVPFISHLKDKTMKLYFWNTSDSNIEIKNIDVSVLAK